MSVFFHFTQNLMSLFHLHTQMFSITRKKFSVMSLISLSFCWSCSHHAHQIESCFLFSVSTIFSPTIFISSFFSSVLQNISTVTSRILTYFSTGLVLLFIHSNVHVHVILLNMKHYIYSAVNILIYLTYLSLLFISLCLSCIVFSL